MTDITIPNYITAQPITRGPKYHYFGYYEKFPWDATERWMLGLEADFMDRPPTEKDTLTIGLIDTQNGNSWKPLAKTHVWNWQQGCMLQWLGDGSSGEIIFNDRQDGAFVSRILNIHTGNERVLSRPVYAVNRAGTHAVSLNFSRLQHQRPGYGYAGVPDKWEKIGEPEDDGVFAIDLKTGQSRLVLSLAEVAAFQRIPFFDGKLHRFNHAQFSKKGDRFAFLHRYKYFNEEKGASPMMQVVGNTRLMTANIDGSELCCLSDHDMISHYDWRGNSEIIAWAHRHDLGDHYYLFQDKTCNLEIVGEKIFSTDGHCSFSPDGKWILTDTYPDRTNHRTLILYHLESNERIDIGRFYAPPMDWQIRCDLHPRWSRSGDKICIDSIHEGTRQIYVLDVSTIVR